MATTYAELKTEIADFLNRDDLTDVIPTFIKLGEAQIARDLRHRLQEKRVTATLDEQYEALPSDFLEARRIIVNGDVQLRPISGEDMAKYRYANNTAGEPKYYYITADQIELYPTPTGTDEMSLLYYARIPALSDTVTSNWLLDENPDAYLYASLLHAAPYLADDARLPMFIQMYQSIIAALNGNSNREQWSGGSLVMRVK